MTLKGIVGERVRRKRDCALGVITRRDLAVPAKAHPGKYGKTIVGVTLDDPALRAAAGGDMVGDLGWLRSYFKGAAS